MLRRKLPIATCFAAFGLIGCLFAVKYGPRVSIHPVTAALISLAVLGLQFFAARRIGIASATAAARRPVLLIFSGLAVYTALVLMVYLRMDPLQLRVDRWSSLDNVWRAMFQGRYPYGVASHLGHPISGFPCMFLLALPFYLLGDVGWMQFAALFAFALLLLVKFRETGRPVFLLLLLLGLPVFEYEVFVRSDLFANAVVAAWLIHLGLPPGRSSGSKVYFWAVAWGLMLSTRGIVLIPLIFTALHLLRNRDLKTHFAFGLVLSAVFLATFLPFYLWNPQLFWSHNPYDVQSGYIPRPGLAMVILISCLLGFVSRRNPRLFLFPGVLIYATVLGCWVFKSMKFGWAQALWGSEFDISYFSLSIPFLLIALGESLPGNLRKDSPADSRVT